ncbi:TRAP transporter small permease [Rhodobacteraceae bacterium]|nr:C4-dicarboxylate ABC transporter permease [Marinovum sp.]MDA8740538.1 TRAP transporter small permease [Paracoccaceae bacterium]|tara:strand:- start:9828 stop:10412 length:585 start_codon:yes stop_codon:yes gene_type:complete
MYSLIKKLAHAMAVLGGLVLISLILLVCTSVLGRSVGTVLHGAFMQTNFTDFSNWALGVGIGAINGDFELVEAGVAFAIFAFLPLCQLSGSHATVDVLTSKLSLRSNQVLKMISECLFALVLGLIAWRLFAGMEAKQRYGETTFLLQFPIWWAYAASFLGAALAALVSIFMAIVRILEALSGKELLTENESAEQ